MPYFAYVLFTEEQISCMHQSGQRIAVEHPAVVTFTTLSCQLLCKKWKLIILQFIMCQFHGFWGACQACINSINNITLIVLTFHSDTGIRGASPFRLWIWLSAERIIVPALCPLQYRDTNESETGWTAGLQKKSHSTNLTGSLSTRLTQFLIEKEPLNGSRGRNWRHANNSEKHTKSTDIYWQLTIRQQLHRWSKAVKICVFHCRFSRHSLYHIILQTAMTSIRPQQYT